MFSVYAAQRGIHSFKVKMFGARWILIGKLRTSRDREKRVVDTISTLNILQQLRCTHVQHLVPAQMPSRQKAGKQSCELQHQLGGGLLLLCFLRL